MFAKNWLRLALQKNTSYKYDYHPLTEHRSISVSALPKDKGLKICTI